MLVEGCKREQLKIHNKHVEYSLWTFTRDKTGFPIVELRDAPTQQAKDVEINQPDDIHIHIYIYKEESHIQLRQSNSLLFASSVTLVVMFI